MDREALRRLDRLDCIVLEGSLVAGDRSEVRTVIAAPELDELEARRLVQARFDPARPIGKVDRDGYVLEPLGAGGPLPPPEMLSQALDLGARGGLVLALSRGGRVLALAEVEWIAQTGIEELVAAAREAQMRVVIAADDEGVLSGFAADDTIPAGEGMLRGSGVCSARAAACWWWQPNLRPRYRRPIARSGCCARVKRLLGERT